MVGRRVRPILFVAKFNLNSTQSCPNLANISSSAVINAQMDIHVVAAILTNAVISSANLSVYFHRLGYMVLCAPTRPVVSTSVSTVLQ